MKRALSLILAGVVLSGTAFVARAEAGGKKDKHGRYVYSRYDDRYDRRYDDRRYNDRYDGRYFDRRYDGRYFRPRDVVVIRDYYRPYYRQLPPGLARRYYRTGGYLPPGWARRVRPVPVYLEPELVVVPRGYRRGLLDGHAVVYNDRGFILDLAVLF